MNDLNDKQLIREGLIRRALKALVFDKQLKAFKLLQLARQLR